MLENGYIKDHRALLSWGWFQDPFTAHLWEYLRLAANWDERTFKGHTIQRGQLVTSYPSMADATGMSVQNVRTAVKHLKQTGEITMKSYRDFSIITITNYEKYQSDQQADNSPTNSLANSPLTGCQQAAHSQLTTNEESKKAKKQESKKNIESASALVFELPLNDGSLFEITQNQVEEWEKLYPAVDILQDLRNMKGWLNANTAKRKTKRGILRFITGWLSRTQDKGGNRPKGQETPQPNGELADWEREWLEEQKKRREAKGI